MSMGCIQSDYHDDAQGSRSIRRPAARPASIPLLAEAVYGRSHRRQWKCPHSPIRSDRTKYTAAPQVERPTAGHGPEQLGHARILADAKVRDSSRTHPALYCWFLAFSAIKIGRA